MYHLLIVTHFFVLLPVGELEDAGEEGELQLSWWRKWTRNTKYENTPCSVLMLLEKACSCVTSVRRLARCQLIKSLLKAE